MPSERVTSALDDSVPALSASRTPWADEMARARARTSRSFKSISAALDEVKNARIFAGIHFRSATDDGQKLGASVAEYVLEHAVQPVP